MFAFFAAVWQNRDETWNLHQTHDSELIKEDKRKEVEEEIRIQVWLESASVIRNTCHLGLDLDVLGLL